MLTADIRGYAPTERRADAPRRAALASTAIRARPEPRALGEVLGVRWGRMQGWEVVAASTVQPPVTYIFDIGLIEAGGKVDLEPATPAIIGGLTEPPADGIYLRNAAGGAYSWTPAAAGTAYVWGIGLEEGPPGTIDLQPATPTEIGGMTEPAADGQYARSAAAGVYSWVPLAAGGLTFDTGLTLTGTSVNLDPALPPGGEIGGINEPPADTGLQYTRSYTGGVGIWTEMTGGGYTFGIGLDEVPPGSFNIDLLPATPTVIGGVSVVARSLTQGLDLTVPGALTAPLATDLLAGSIVEPVPSDTILYARKRTVAGVSSWEPVQAGAFVGDDPPPAPNTQGQFWFESDTGRLFLYYDDGAGAPQWVQVGGP